MAKPRNAPGTWRGIAADDRWRFQRLAREGAENVERPWGQARRPVLIEDRPAVIRSIRKQLAKIQPHLAMDWQADMLGDVFDITERNRDRIAVATPAPRAKVRKTKGRPKQPASLAPSYAFNSVLTLAKRMRWDEAQTGAAQRYHGVFELLASSGPGALDLERVSGGGSSLHLPAVERAEAAEVYASVRTILGDRDAALIRMMVGEGIPARGVAEREYGDMSDKTLTEVKTRIGAGLTRLAAAWPSHHRFAGNAAFASGPATEPGSRIEASRGPKAADVGQPREIVPGRAYVGVRIGSRKA